jgi:hypothetical protein
VVVAIALSCSALLSRPPLLGHCIAGH